MWLFNIIKVKRNPNNIEKKIKHDPTEAFAVASATQKQMALAALSYINNRTSK